MNNSGSKGKKPSNDNKKKNNNKRWNAIVWILLVFAVLSLLNSQSFNVSGVVKELKYSEFYALLEGNPNTRSIVSLSKTENVLYGQFADGSRFVVNIPVGDEELIPLIRSNVVEFEVKPPRTFLLSLLLNLGPILLLIGFWWLMASKGEQLGNRIMGFGKVRSKKVIEKGDEKITFKDVAGVDEAKEELQEVVEFLKDPKRFQRLGGKIPKGVLLVGPPGCGKTLIAKAVSGEAGVPFFSISGSDFVEMFVGVGASRVRDLFEQGRRAAKLSGKGAIIFIDEIDAVGRLRFSGIGGGHDEREQTLNQLLVEMDGFDTQIGLILIAATNRPDTLDPALLRPGRFDRHIVVNLPDILGREAILKVHSRQIKLDPKADFKIIARQTPGFSGADLANLCNEAALLAARKDKEFVTIGELEAAIERVMMGPEKKSRVMNKKEREITAFHESGHALLSLLISEVDPMRKVSIIPRGLAGGYTLTPPVEDKHYYSRKELLGRLTVSLGGRVSEELTFKDVTTGAANDLENATTIARRMVCEFGMSEKLGNVALALKRGPIFLGRDLAEEKNYSNDTAKIIDQEIAKIIKECYARAKKLLEENSDKLNKLADVLLEKEILDSDTVRKLLDLPQADTGKDNSQEKS